MFTSSFMMPTYLSYMPLMYPQGASAPGFPTPSAATTTPTLLDVKASSSAPSPLPLPATVPASAPVTTSSSSICVSSLRMETPHEIQAKFLGACNCSSCSSVPSSKESSCGSIDSKTGSAFSQIDDDLVKGRLSLGLGAKPESSAMYPGASLMSMGMGMGMGMPRGMSMSLPPGLGMPMVSMFSVQSPYGLPMSYPGVASTPAVEVVPTRPLALDHTSASAVAVSHNSDENSNRPYTRKRNTTKRYHCSECPKKFHQRSNLITHVRTHTGEKPFACPFPDCQRRFSQSSNLRRHQRIHSRDFNGTSGSGSTSGSTTSVPISSLVSPSGKPSATISERSVSPNSEEDEHDSSDSERDENGLSAILEADEKVAASSLTNLGTSAAQTTAFAAAK